MKFAKTTLICALTAVTLLGAGCQKTKSIKTPENKPTKLVKLEQSVSVLNPVFSTSLPTAKARKGQSISKKDIIDLQVAKAHDILIAGSRSGMVSAYQNSKAIWSVDVGSPITSGVSTNDDGSVAVVGTRAGQIIAIDVATGNTLWTKSLTSSSLAPTLISGNSVLVSTNDGVLYGLDLSTGNQIWQFSTQNPDVSVRGIAKPLALDSRTVLFGTADGRIHAINPQTGTPLWTRRIGFATGGSQVQRMNDVDGTPLVVGRYLYASSYGGRLMAFDMGTGQMMFETELASTKSLAMQGGLLFGASTDGEIIAFNATTGQKQWQNDELKYRKLTNLVAIGDYVAVGDLEGVIHVIDSTGVIISRTQTKGKLTSLQSVDDYLYTQSTDGIVSVWRTH